MSAQFGRWNFEGEPPTPEYIEKVSVTLAPYGPDSDESYSNGGIRILYRAFHTTKESRRETQPHVSPSEPVITWDGRLDNRTELLSELRGSLTSDSTDLVIVGTAFEKWGTNCFAKLIGDWALSIWNHGNRSLILAKDPIGTRHLYYSFDNHQVTWSTILAPLVRLASKTFALNEEYIAGWLSQFPATHLTPYVGIHAVPSSTFVLLGPGKHSVRRYWDFDPGKRILYRADAEYEEHFRTVFATAVQRRLRSDSPILAELSGGRDSCSIVCMADTIMAEGTLETPRLDTVSYYDDSEPNWDERPYFTKVEEKRGRSGCHLNIGPDQKTQSEPSFASNGHGFLMTPSYSVRFPEFDTCLTSQGNRVVLSGVGGDEVMGGVPTPTPDLQDLLAKARLSTLAHQLKTWALQKRKPWFHLLLEAVRGFFPPVLVGVPKNRRPVPWLRSTFVNRHRAALAGYPSRVKLFGPPASFQDNVSTLNTLRRQLACTVLPVEPTYEKRYPYLDRDLLEFMYAIPRDQSVRPTQRRSLMRRALGGIVPEEILNKRGKSPVFRAPVVGIRKDWANLALDMQHMVSGSLEIVEAELFCAALQKARKGEEVSMVAIIRMTHLERWLKNLRTMGIVELDGTTERHSELRSLMED